MQRPSYMELVEGDGKLAGLVDSVLLLTLRLCAVA